MVRQFQKRGIRFRSIINGVAESAATLMAMICDVKQITPNSHAMIHELSSMNWGNYNSLKSTSKHLDDVHNAIVKLYETCRRDEGDDVKISDLLLRETWFTAQEYLDIGFVDEIV